MIPLVFKCEGSSAVFKIIDRISLIASILAISVPFSLPAEAVPNLQNSTSTSNLSAQRIQQKDHNWVDIGNNSLQPTEKKPQNSSMSQVNEVDRLRDVSPVDWS